MKITTTKIIQFERFQTMTRLEIDFLEKKIVADDPWSLAYY
jgi:hypothetical protein